MGGNSKAWSSSSLALNESRSGIAVPQHSSLNDRVRVLLGISREYGNILYGGCIGITFINPPVLHPQPYF